jgi:hypothetical protein
MPGRGDIPYRLLYRHLTALQLCVNLTSGAPAVYANFATGLAPSCTSENGWGRVGDYDSFPGEWATIFGIWVSGSDFGVGSSDVINPW